MRRQKRVLCVQQGFIGGNRGFAVKDVDPGPGDAALVQRVRQRGAVHNRPPGTVDQQRSRLHAGDLRPADHAARRGVARHMQRYDVALLHQFLQPDIADAQRFGLRTARPRKRDHRRAKGLKELCRNHADAARADDADRLARDFPAHQPRGRPAAANRLIGGHNVAHQPDRQADRQLRDRLVGVVRGVADHHAPFAAGFEPDVVNAGKRDVEHPKRLRRPDDLRRIGIVGDHDHFASLAPSLELFRIRGLCVIVDERVALCANRRSQRLDFLTAHADRLQQADLHGSSLLDFIRPPISTASAAAPAGLSASFPRSSPAPRR